MSFKIGIYLSSWRLKSLYLGIVFFVVVLVVIVMIVVVSVADVIIFVAIAAFPTFFSYL